MVSGTAETEQQAAPEAEQTPDADDEQTNALPAADAGADDADEANADPESATEHDDPEPEAFDFDALLSDGDTLAKLLEHPEVQKARNQSVADATTKVKQSTEARIRREAGTRENVAAVFTRLVNAAGVDLQTLDQTAVRELQAALGMNRAFEAAALAREFPEKLFGIYNLPADSLTEALLKRDSGDVDGYLRTIVDAVVQTETTAAWADHGLADVPPGSKLAKEIAADKKTWQADEKKAADMTAKQNKNGKVENPPKTPKGSTGGTSKLTFQKLKKMTSAEIGALDQTEVDAVLMTGAPD